MGAHSFVSIVLVLIGSASAWVQVRGKFAMIFSRGVVAGFLCAFMLCLKVECFGKDAQQQRGDIQDLAQGMLERARQLSDIRSTHAPAFRLKVSFSFTGKDLDRVQGTYTEIWVSNSQWRRETTVGPLRQITIGSLDKEWILDGGEDFPEDAVRVSGMTQMFPPAGATFQFDTSLDRDTDTPCFVTRPGPMKQRHAFCFDKPTNLLVESVAPLFIGQRLADYSCKYGHFQKFGAYLFPGEMACYVDKHERVHGVVKELTRESSPQSELFAPPPGAIEVARCSMNAVAPRAVHTPDPSFPGGVRDHQATVVLWMIVDVKGNPQNVRVARSGGKGFDESAIKTVQRWRFKPGSCNGIPSPMPINVEVNFRLYR